MENKQYTWDLASLYNDDAQIDKDIMQASEQAQAFVGKYQNHQLQIETLKSSLDEYFAIVRILNKPMTYAHHKLDESTIVASSARLEAKVKTRCLEIYSTLAFYMPLLTNHLELLKIAYNDEAFKNYKQVLKEIILNGKYTLEAPLEALLADASEALSSASGIYETLTNADIKFDDVYDQDGIAKPMSHGLYSAYLQSSDRILRKNSFEAMLENFAKYNMTLTKTYTSQISKDILMVKTRGYSSTRQRALVSNNLEEAIYDNLLAVMNENLEINHKYINLRSKILDYKQLHLYDMYVPLVADVDQKYSFEQAKEIIIKALKPLGDEYLKIVKQAFTERWIDVYEREGKRSGAYSGGCYDSKPFILLNYTETLNDVYTLAHELGHSIHSYLANQKQAYHNASYVIFIAEIASTLNELLLTDYLYTQAKDARAQAHILNYKLEQYRTTVVRQTMFAEFEYMSKRTIEDGEKLANEDLNAMYYELNEKYFGSQLVIDELIKYEWTRIPHFYYNYYVYQYATSFCYSVMIFNRIKAESDYSQKYLDFLSIGGSLGAVESLQTIDIDARSKAPYQAAFDDFKASLELFEKLKLEDKC